MHARKLALLVPLALAGCALFTDSAPSVGTCDPTNPGANQFSIQTGAVDDAGTLDFRPGIDGGYYISYQKGGHWRIEWTCDAALAADGCVFGGTIDLPGPPGTATCKGCRCGDAGATFAATAVAGEAGEHTRVTFCASTPSGTGVIDLAQGGGAGAPATFDLTYAGVLHPELVFFPSNGHYQQAPCLPFQAKPTQP